MGSPGPATAMLRSASDLRRRAEMPSRVSPHPDRRPPRSPSGTRRQECLKRNKSDRIGAYFGKSRHWHRRIYPCKSAYFFSQPERIALGRWCPEKPCKWRLSGWPAGDRPGGVQAEIGDPRRKSGTSNRGTREGPAAVAPRVPEMVPSRPRSGRSAPFFVGVRRYCEHPKGLQLRPIRGPQDPVLNG